MLVCASSVLTNSSRSTREVFGSKTRRTAASLPDSSRTASSRFSMTALACVCSGVRLFLPDLTFGLVISSISSRTFWPDVPGGSSVITSCHWPRAISSNCQRARTFSEPRPAR
ncbi:hypothetical protein G6F35_017495 [Rhizopus arrhizus]|nr:hypothetical protein G6F35_017495 [Rhizopus arrhizus]